MSDMPEEIWAIHVWIDDATWYECFVPGTEKYIRADLHKSRGLEIKLRKAVAALRFIDETVSWEINTSNFDRQEVRNMNSDWREIGDMAYDTLVELGEESGETT